MSSAESEASLPYHEPGIATILIISSFLLSLNVVNYILDKIVYCGLVGQLFIGVAWGIPGADWLSHELQRSIVQLGYIGLVLIVYEGGISSNLKALKANLLLSSAVALTGIMAPIGLSFVLLGLLPLSPVNAFAAGAALCSTSLGTTFTVLATSGLTESRLGVVLTSAAMMDDIVGLIMVQIISSLSGGSSFSAVTVIRPVFVSIAFAIVVPLVCTFIAKPVVLATNDRLRQPQNTRLRAILYCSKATWIYQTALLLAMVTGATYAGTSNLFAAYLAGAAVTWLCDCVSSHEQGQSSAVDRAASNNSRPAVQRAQSITSQRSDGLNTSSSDANNAAAASSSNNHAEAFSGKKIYEIYYSPVVESILRPLFFASIGFAIPITKMFTGRVIWRGLVYTILMLFAKVICGLWLVRFAPMPRGKAIAKALAAVHSLTFGSFGSANTKDETTFVRDRGEAINVPRSPSSLQNNSLSRGSAVMELDQTTANNTQPVPDTRILANTTRKRTALPKPKSLYPAAILGSAMVARGEIGFLISSVAESNGVFGEGENTEEFLVVTWAILLCTLIGPITVGLLVKRVRRLQQTERKKAVGQEDPLGIWGVSPPSATP